MAYLPGLLVLNCLLRRAGSGCPLEALYPETFPEKGHRVLAAQGVPKQRVPYLCPTQHKDYTSDPRFYDCWSKLTPFKLVQFNRVVQLDSDMLVLQNMDELMDPELSGPESAGKGDRVSIMAEDANFVVLGFVWKHR